MVRVIVFVLSLIVSIIFTTYIAWLGVDMWNWYMVPLLGTKPANVSMIFGAIMILSLLSIMFEKAKVGTDDTDEEEMIEQFSSAVGNVFGKMFAATVVYGIMYLHNSWFM